MRETGKLEKKKEKKSQHSDLSIAERHNSPFSSPRPFASFRTSSSWRLAQLLVFALGKCNDGVCLAGAEGEHAQTRLGAQ